MVYPLAEHVPTRRATLAQLGADVLSALKAEDANLTELRTRFLSMSAFLDTPLVQFHRGQREAFAFVLRHIEEIEQRTARNEMSEAMEQ